MLFVDKQAFNKSNTSRSIIECLSIIVAKANYNGIIVNHRQRSEILKKLKFFFSNIQLKLSKCTHILLIDFQYVSGVFIKRI